MSTIAVAKAVRQGLILAGTAGLHVGALVLIASGLIPQLASREPPPLPVTIVPPPPEMHPGVLPDPVRAANYQMPVEPMPQPAIPRFEENLPSRTGSADSQAPAGRPATAVSSADGRSPALRTRDRRLAALIDACYPSAARRLGEAGRVIVRIVIDAQGRAASWAIEQGSGFSRLDAAADCVIGRLEFVAGRRDGRAVEAVVLLPIAFRLD